MALFRRFFYRKPPDRLLEISERVYVFDCCFSTDVFDKAEYKVYLEHIAFQLQEHFPDASFMVYNFREGESQSQTANILSEYDMTVMEYPMHYQGCPLLTLEMIHHYLRSSEAWLSVEGQENVLLMHCERGGWPLMAFMLAGLLIYRKHYTGEQKALEMLYKQAPRELLLLLSPLSHMPSQLRYLRYVSRRNTGSEWLSLERALTLDCIIFRNLPNFNGEGGCRPMFQICGQDPLITANRTPKVLFLTPKKREVLQLYKQAECESIKIDIHCHIQGDIVLECITVDEDFEHEEMMFRIMFNPAFIISGILMLNREEIDILWDSKDRFPEDFRAEVHFSEMELLVGEKKDGFPVTNSDNSQEKLEAGVLQNAKSNILFEEDSSDKILGKPELFLKNNMNNSTGSVVDKLLKPSLKSSPEPDLTERNVQPPSPPPLPPSLQSHASQPSFLVPTVKNSLVSPPTPPPPPPLPPFKWLTSKVASSIPPPQPSLVPLVSAAVPNFYHGKLGEKSDPHSLPGDKSNKVQLIGLTRAHNCELMLTNIKVPLPDLMNSVLALDDSVLDVDQVNILIKCCPTKEEIELLKGFNGHTENLGKCEQFFLELMKIPRVSSKLSVFSFKIQFTSQVSDLKNSLNIVNCAAQEIRSSVKLERIMQMICSLGNALNQGTATNSAIGFRLQSLLCFTDTHARYNGATLMHHLCKVIANKPTELLDFHKDLVSLDAASKIQLKYLAEEMKAICQGLEKVKEELTEAENDGPISQTYGKNLKNFLVVAEAEVMSLASLYSEAGRNADSLASYFGGDLAHCSFEQASSTLANFVIMFCHANEEYHEQHELEKKKAQAELEKKKTQLEPEKKYELEKKKEQEKKKAQLELEKKKAQLELQKRKTQLDLDKRYEIEKKKAELEVENKKELEKKKTQLELKHRKELEKKKAQLELEKKKAQLELDKKIAQLELEKKKEQEKKKAFLELEKKKVQLELEIKKELEKTKAQLELVKKKELEKKKAQLELQNKKELEKKSAQLELENNKELEKKKAQLELEMKKAQKEAVNSSRAKFGENALRGWRQ